MRKIIIYIALAMGLFVANSAKAQSNFDQIITSLKSGDASSLAGYFEKSVEITTKENESTYSKTQAEQVLSRFFSSHDPKSFTIVHQGTSPEGSKYVIGTLVTSSGTFRTYIYAKQNGSALLIQQIRFEDQ